MQTPFHKTFASFVAAPFGRLAMHEAFFIKLFL